MENSFASGGMYKLSEDDSNIKIIQCNGQGVSLVVSCFTRFYQISRCTDVTNARFRRPIFKLFLSVITLIKSSSEMK